MLSVLSVLEVEERIGEVPGVESVTVNHAAGSATVRYDETRLEVADIKSLVRQRGYKSAGESEPEPVSEPGPEPAHGAGAPSPQAGPASVSTPENAAPKASTAEPAAAPGPVASAGDGQQDKAVPAAPPSTAVAAAPKSSPAAPAPVPSPRRQSPPLPQLLGFARSSRGRQPRPLRRNPPPPRHPRPPLPHNHRAKACTTSPPGKCWHNPAPQRPDCQNSPRLKPPRNIHPPVARRRG